MLLSIVHIVPHVYKLHRKPLLNVVWKLLMIVSLCLVQY